MVNKKYAGFTMLECLVALVVLSCMCQLFQLMIQQSFIGNQYLKNNDSKSLRYIFNSIRKRMSKARFPNRLCSRDFFPRLRNKQDYFNSNQRR